MNEFIVRKYTAVLSCKNGRKKSVERLCPLEQRYHSVV